MSEDGGRPGERHRACVLRGVVRCVSGERGKVSPRTVLSVVSRVERGAGSGEWGDGNTWCMSFVPRRSGVRWSCRAGEAGEERGGRLPAHLRPWCFVLVAAFCLARVGLSRVLVARRESKQKAKEMETESSNCETKRRCGGGGGGGGSTSAMSMCTQLVLRPCTPLGVCVGFALPHPRARR
jgi:hypothetical protein